MEDKYTKIILQMLSRFGSLKAVSEFTSWSLVFVWRKSGLPIENCDDAYDVLLSIFNDPESIKLLHTNVNGYEIGIDNMVGSLVWSKYKQHDTYEFYATPFWDGNCLTPIDVSYIKIVDKYNSKDFEFDEDVQNLEQYPTPDSFENIDSFIEYFNGTYVPQAYFTIENYIREIKDRMFGG
jgi:hypothetical protein